LFAKMTNCKTKNNSNSKHNNLFFAACIVLSPAVYFR
jgi:hypothetical protein